ncbi:MAG: antitoxin [Ruminococcus sp.]|nr:antitoxin [Ruminococcus sp.]
MGKTSNESKRKYNEKTYDRIILNVPKGKKEEYKQHAFWKNESLNAFIKRAIERQIEEDEKK